MIGRCAGQAIVCDLSFVHLAGLIENQIHVTRYGDLRNTIDASRV